MSESQDRFPVLWWDSDAYFLAKELIAECGLSLDEAEARARELVILDALRDGDTNPYRDWILRGYNASPRVQRATVYMMERGDPESCFDPAGAGASKESMLFQIGLSIERDGAGRPIDKRKQSVKEMAGRYSSALMDKGLKGREAADPDTQKAFAVLGENLSVGTVEAARKKYRRERRGK